MWTGLWTPLCPYVFEVALAISIVVASVVVLAAAFEGVTGDAPAG